MKNSFISFTFISFKIIFSTLGMISFFILITTGLALAQTCPSELNHHWMLEETSPPYVDSCNGNDATCTNCPTDTTDSKIGILAQYFDGIDDEVNAADNDTFDWGPADSFSIELWMQTSESTAGNRVFVGRDDPATALHWWVGADDNGTVRFALFDTNGDGEFIGGVGDVLNDGAWHHIVAVRDNGADENRIYVDGVLIDFAGHDYTAGFSSTVDLNIGYLNLGGNFRYNGILDEVALWDKALTETEIRSHYYLARGYSEYCDTPVIIMPLGDSITAGNASGAEPPGEDPWDPQYWISYRKDLWEGLDNAGYAVDFVGDLMAGDFYTPPFDPDHEGHLGMTDAWIAENIYNGLLDDDSGLNILASNPPEVVLLHIGTNAPDISELDVEDILNEIDQFEADYNTDVTVILARVINLVCCTDIPACGDCQVTTDFNDNVEAMAQDRIADGDKIIIVDMENGAGINYTLQPAGDMAGNVHPYFSGYQKMAGVWHGALTTFLPVCAPPTPTPPLITSTPVTTALLGRAYTYDVDASGYPEPTFTLIQNPDGMTINPSTGLIAWTPVAGQAGPHAVEIEALNTEGSDIQNFTIDVASCPLDMTHYWKLDETGSPTTFFDSVGTNDAICTNCPAPIAGIIDGAQYFDGSNDEVNLTDDGTLDWGPGDSFSIECWMQTIESTSGNRVIIGRDDNTIGLHWWVGVDDNGTVRFALYSNGDGEYIGGVGDILNDGLWHHIVAVRDNSAQENRIYVDGVLIDSALHTYGASFSSTVEVNIGHLINGNHYHGSVDQIAVYDSVLDLTEIQLHYNDRVGRDYCFECQIDDDCDDGIYCNGTETCDVNNVCQPGISLDCDDGVGCTDDSCDIATDTCLNEPNDGNCDDAVDCTDDTCDLTQDCQFTPNDGNCDDAVACTDDICDPLNDCQYTANDFNCNDDDYCTGIEYCDEVSDCQSTGNPCDPLICDDVEDICLDSTVTLIVLDSYGTSGNITLFLENLEDAVSEVNFDLCDPEINNWLTIPTGTCKLTKRVPKGSNAACDITDPIPGDGCISITINPDSGNYIDLGTGPIAQLSYILNPEPPLGDVAYLIPYNTELYDDESVKLKVTPIAGTIGAGCDNNPDCNDNNQCTSDTCNAGICEYSNLSGSCDDGLYCTVTDTCIDGTCEGSSRTCSDGISCTDDSCNEATNNCDNIPNNANCDNGLWCDGAETCDALAGCQDAPDPDCNDAVACTDDSCNDTTDSCDNIPNNANCDNGLWCDGAETCDALADCQNGTAPDCTDTVACTDDSCNDTTDSCDNIPNNANCDNGLWCDGAETCDALAGCQDAPDPDCNDAVACTDDICNETTDSCVNTPNNTNCDNGLWCDGAETCDALADCQDGPDPDCNDSVGCTDDSCNEATDSCNNLPNHSTCDDSINCTVDTCHPSLDCQFTPFDAFCYDGEYCTGVEYCDSVSDCQSTGNPCTPSGCDAGEDMCIDSTISLIVLDAFGSEGTIKLLLENLEEEVSQVNFELCDPEINDWLRIALGNCLLTNRVPQGPDASCVTSDPIPDDGCITIAIAPETGFSIELGRGPIAELSYTIIASSQLNQLNYTGSANSPLTEIAYLIPGNTDLRDDNDDTLTVTPIPGILSFECVLDEDCNDYNDCTDDTCDPDLGCQFTPKDGNCDDGLFCTADDSCFDGECVGVARNCDDNLFCTGVESCNEATNQCDSSGKPCSWFCDEDNDVCLTPPTTTIPPSECETDEDCDDGNSCTEDFCLGTSCNNVTLDNGTECSDKLFCTVEDACVDGTCVGTVRDCDDGLYCTGSESCNEETDQCDSSGDPCSSDEVCDEDEAICKTAPGAPSIVLDPPSWFQSRWIPFIMFLKIKGSNTHFGSLLVTEVTFNPVNSVWALPPYVKDDETISIIIFIMPLWFTGPLNAPIEVTVTTGEEEVTGLMDVRVLPFPFDME